jgi:ABC-type lipoprotein export system ATPase subunit
VTVPNAVDAHGLRKSFGTTCVLDGVDVRVPQRGSVAVTGPSGTGKSTLMAVLGLLTGRDGGSLCLFGRDVPQRLRPRAVWQFRARMAWVPQAPLVLPGRSCLDNALTGVRCRRRVRPDDLVYTRELLAQVGLDGVSGRNVSVLSGGELQRLAVVRAMAVRPELILADEPTASLDAANTAAVVSALRGVAGRAALIVASHDPEVIAACQHTLHIRSAPTAAASW